MGALSAGMDATLEMRDDKVRASPSLRLPIAYTSLENGNISAISLLLLLLFMASSTLIRMPDDPKDRSSVGHLAAWLAAALQAQQSYFDVYIT